MNAQHPALQTGTVRILIALAAMTAMLLAAQAFPGAVRSCFCAPSAWLSSQFLGAGMRPMDGGFRLDCATLPVDVTLACSGTTFFALLFGLLMIVSRQPAPDRTSWRGGLEMALTALVLAYPITLAANTARIVLGWHAAVWAHAALPPAFHPGVHLAVGIIVFSGFLVLGILAQHAGAARTADVSGPLNREPSLNLETLEP